MRNYQKGISGFIVGSSDVWQRRTYFLVLLSVGVTLSLGLLGYLDFKYFVISIIAFCVMLIWIKIRRYLFSVPHQENHTYVHHISRRKWF